MHRLEYECMNTTDVFDWHQLFHSRFTIVALTSSHIHTGVAASVFAVFLILLISTKI